MNEQAASRIILQHTLHRLNEFFDENPSENMSGIDAKQIAIRFERWLYAKDCVTAPFKAAGGVIAQHFNHEQVADDKSLVIARLMLFQDHGIGLLWMADLFVNPAAPIPDELREEMVKTLRFHADKLESRDIDERLKQVYKSETGVA